MLTPEDFFDLSLFEHNELFEGLNLSGKYCPISKPT